MDPLLGRRQDAVFWAKPSPHGFFHAANGGGAYVKGTRRRKGSSKAEQKWARRQNRRSR